MATTCIGRELLVLICLVIFNHQKTVTKPKKKNINDFMSDVQDVFMLRGCCQTPSLFLFSKYAGYKYKYIPACVYYTSCLFVYIYTHNIVYDFLTTLFFNIFY